MGIPGNTDRKLPTGLLAVAILSWVGAALVLGLTLLFCVIDFSGMIAGGHQGSQGRFNAGACLTELWSSFHWTYAYWAGLGIAGAGVFSSRFRDWARFLYVTVAAGKVLESLAKSPAKYWNMDLYARNRAVYIQVMLPEILWWSAVLLCNLWLIWYMLRRAKQSRPAPARR
jgi:hypothetical protein